LIPGPSQGYRDSGFPHRKSGVVSNCHEPSILVAFKITCFQKGKKPTSSWRRRSRCGDRCRTQHGRERLLQCNEPIMQMTVCHGLWQQPNQDFWHVSCTALPISACGQCCAGFFGAPLLACMVPVPKHCRALHLALGFGSPSPRPSAGCSP
jgi:hypothetical protein